MTDPALAGPAPHADPRSFDTVVESAGPDSLVALIDRAMGPAARGLCEPEDVWQEALAQAWRDRDQHVWTGVRGWRNWVLTIAKNRIRDMLRVAQAAKRGGTAGAVPFAAFRGDTSGSLADLLPAGSVTPSRIASHNERARIVVAALATLGDDVEPVVRLHLLEERPMPEVAAELGLELSAAWRRFRRGAEAYRAAVRSLSSSHDRPPGA